MAISPVTLINSKFAENVQTTQYTASGVRTVVSQFTATNVSAANATIAVNVVPSGGAAGSSNLVVATKTIAPGKSYTFPEVVGVILENGQFISTLAGTASAIVLRASGYEYSS